jgi:hypothetical protein
MKWLVFSSTLPSKAPSSPRVALWRRLRRLGAVSPTAGLYVLPAREECLEAFQWLAEEVQHAKGEALVMRVEQFDGLSDTALMERFRQARAEDYATLETQATALEAELHAELTIEERSHLREILERVRRQHAEVARIDFFEAPEGGLLASRLGRIAQTLSAGEQAAAPTDPAALEVYREARWVTRPRPHVDRLSCIWLIRRFINPQAPVRYSPTLEPGEAGFDMPGGKFTHRGSLCTFETMVRAFGLEDPSLQPMSEIIHEIDLRDGRYAHSETAGIDAVLKGWLLAGLADAELEAHGVALFEGLYADLSRRTRQPPSKRRGRKGDGERT